ncbi:D-2-hydroxyacid dehydrogenase [Henriciella sp.]|uniref:D-2-hydroxyacid dehydrogenase n=1 Tax=Henriciella sp. TaxID=1968823 RepID=UPI00263796CA|nr:D-2-hydroxyacid dehydrogenase [Henriciella sp.]
MAWTRDDITLRIHDKNAPEIRAAIAERFPDLRFSDGPFETSGLKVLLGFRPPTDEALESYDWVHAAGAGVDYLCDAITDIDMAPVITRTTGRMGEQIGEYCLAYALAHLQKMRWRENLARDRRWDKQGAVAEQLFDCRVAILGTGAIGASIANIFRSLSAKVLGYSRSGTPREGFDDVMTFADPEGLEQADIVILALPSTPDTEGVVGAGMLKALNNALLINIGRGATLDSGALRQALADGNIAAAILDVFEVEPLPEDDWRWAHPDVTVTPHVSGPTRTVDTIERFCELLEAYMQSGEPPASVDVKRGY